jgi:hypothetical protein
MEGGRAGSRVWEELERLVNRGIIEGLGSALVHISSARQMKINIGRCRGW